MPFGSSGCSQFLDPQDIFIILEKETWESHTSLPICHSLWYSLEGLGGTGHWDPSLNWSTRGSGWEFCSELVAPRSAQDSKVQTAYIS